MAGRGVHFAVTADQVSALLAAKSDRKLIPLIDQIEETWEEPFVVETDKAWDAIHRCLTDGSLLFVSGEYPLNHCICGGRQLHRGGDYTVSFVSDPQVKDVAAALDNRACTLWRVRYDGGRPSSGGRHAHAVDQLLAHPQGGRLLLHREGHPPRTRR